MNDIEAIMADAKQPYKEYYWVRYRCTVHTPSKLQVAPGDLQYTNIDLELDAAIDVHPFTWIMSLAAVEANKQMQAHFTILDYQKITSREYYLYNPELKTNDNE